eukprot:TRINITY_DN18893_c0_g1_i1.p1 TRINITY_DN18893_c0_g1~~TRINITY_DN18893_c0_g1_i1.p1  ORF type:complete len:540 (+),score=112.84 TRINITY_DN18893_c0_g1_i1:75-1622(+)
MSVEITRPAKVEDSLALVPITDSFSRNMTDHSPQEKDNVAISSPREIRRASRKHAPERNRNSRIEQDEELSEASRPDGGRSLSRANSVVAERQVHYSSSVRSIRVNSINRSMQSTSNGGQGMEDSFSDLPGFVRFQRVDSITSRSSSFSREEAAQQTVFEDKSNSHVLQKKSIKQRQSDLRFGVISTPFEDAEVLDYTKTLSDALLGQSVSKHLYKQLRKWNAILIAIWLSSAALVYLCIIMENSILFSISYVITPIGTLYTLSYLGLFSLNASLKTLRSVETLFLLCNAVVFCVSIAFYFQFQGPRVFVGVPFLLVNMVLGTMIDAQPLSFGAFAKQLKKLHQAHLYSSSDYDRLPDVIEDVSQLVHSQLKKSSKQTALRVYNQPKDVSDTNYDVTRIGGKRSFAYVWKQRWRLLGLYAHNTWASLALGVMIFVPMLLIIELQIPHNTKSQTVDIFIASWTTDVLLRVTLINTIIIYSKRLGIILLNPMRSMTFERRVVKMPLTPALCDLEYVK